MQIGSWNVNSVRTRLDQVLRWLEQQQPDLLSSRKPRLMTLSFRAGLRERRLAGQHAGRRRTTALPW